MFSTGQLIFVAFFIVAFILVMIFAYRKDAFLHRRAYKGSRWVLLGFLGFIVLLVALKFLLGH